MPRIKDVRTTIYEWVGPVAPMPPHFCTTASDLVSDVTGSISGFRFLGWLVVELELDDGTIGIGNSALAPHAVKTTIDTYLKPLLIGTDPLDSEYIWQSMYRRTLPFGRKGIGMTCVVDGEDKLLGIFTDGTQPAYVAAPAQPVDRLADLEALLRVAPAAAASSPVVRTTVQTPARPIQASYVRQVAPSSAMPSKIWLQLASGYDDAGLSGEYRRLKSKNPDLFDGLTPYVARTAGGARLIVGPFRGRADAKILAEDFESVGIDASNFTNSQADRIAPLAAE